MSDDSFSSEFMIDPVGVGDETQADERRDEQGSDAITGGHGRPGEVEADSELRQVQETHGCQGLTHRIGV